LALAAAGLLKIAATSLSIGSGGSGGVFAPGLLGGALLGLSFYALLEGTADTPLPAMAYAYLGMSAFFAAAAKVPLATSIMVAEMGNNYLLIPPSLLASIVAREISGNTSIYSSQLLHRPPREVIDAEALLALLREKGIKVQLTAGQLADGGVKPVGPETPRGRCSS
ncbi:chloride channel protein, partial [Aeropyrum camini]|uniref:chloride channel protein n=1 Tax=Aeropyrum camini TaxID=229980 RepID=UPI000A4C086F